MLRNYRTAIGIFLALGLVAGGAAFLWTTLAGNKNESGISPSALYATRFLTPDGQSITLGQWQGKTLLINFWATWCAPCREEIPQLIEAQRRHAGQGVQIIGIAVDSPGKV